MRKTVLTAIALAIGGCAAAGAAAPDTTKLPLGDHRYTTSPKTGWVDSCQTSFPASGEGAGTDGPWIDTANGTWDATSKLSVAGSVSHAATHSIRISGSHVTITGNGLPSVSGTFPVSPSDPAYRYDRNPNSITGYVLSVVLPANPQVAAQPTCIGGTIGVTTTGIPIYSAFDATGRDANAHELQDRCGGHPQREGQYHYHALSPCWKDTGRAGGQSGLWGYALDGFGIYGPRAANGKLLSSADLDACHGITSSVLWHGRWRRMYHYVATADFPYLVGCYRGTPISSATGLAIGPPR
jgi:hypothetical protein